MIVDDDPTPKVTYKLTMALARTALLQASVGSGWGATDYLGLGSGTVPSSGMIRVGQGSLVGASSPLINSTATWNNAGTTFQHILVNVTNSASNAASTLIDLQVGGASRFNVTASGTTITGAVGATPALSILVSGVTLPSGSVNSGYMVIAAAASGTDGVFHQGIGTGGAAYGGVACQGPITAPTTVTNGKTLVALVGTGYDGTAWRGTLAPGEIAIQAAGTWSATSHPTQITVGVTPSGSTTLSEVFFIESTGNVQYSTQLYSAAALATPSAFAATRSAKFASTVSGAVLMGYGTTNDVTLMNRAGTVVLGVTANTTGVVLAGALAITGALSGATTGAFSGDVSVSTGDGATPAIFTVGTTGGTAGVRRIRLGIGVGLYNWQLAAQDNVAAGFEITPSTATGGSTFTNPVFQISQAGNAAITGSLTTADPTGGAGAWKLGIANAVSPTSPNRTLTVDIGGTVYYVHAKTTNN